MSRTFNELQIEADIETNITEVQVLTFSSTNIALLGTASSSNSHSSGPPSLSNDGNTTALTNNSINLISGSTSLWSLAFDRDYTLSELETVVFYNRNFNGTRPDLNLDGQNGTITLHSSDLGAPEVVGTLTSGLVQTFTIVQPAELNVTMYTHAAELSWDEVSGASTYSVTTFDSSGEVINTQDVSTLTLNVLNLNVGETYDFIVYSDLDIVTPAYESLANATTSVDQTEAGSLLTFLDNDLTLITSDRVDELNLFLQDNLSTGDEVTGRIQFGNSLNDSIEMKFIQDSETVGFEEIRKPVLTPFVEGDGTKSFLFTKSDTNTESITFDGTSTITVDSIQYSIGDKFILDGKVVKVAKLN